MSEGATGDEQLPLYQKDTIPAPGCVHDSLVPQIVRLEMSPT